MSEKQHIEPQCLFACCEHRKTRYDVPNKGDCSYCEAWDDKQFHNQCPHFLLKTPHAPGTSMVWDYTCDLSRDYVSNESSYHMKNIVPIPTWQIIDTMIQTVREYPDATATQITGQMIRNIHRLANQIAKEPVQHKPNPVKC